MSDFPAAIRVIDSHTEGEPTRVVIDGFPALRAHDMPGRAAELAERWDHLRRAIVCEPRGHDAVVGALLTPPVSEGAAAGVIFFNNVGLLGMCGHGLIGVVRTLHELERTGSDDVVLDTPVGRVAATVDDDAVIIRNVPARATRLDVVVDVPEHGSVRGDVAWGGNWFFITEATPAPLVPSGIPELTRFTQQVKRALAAAAVRGDDDAEIDHVELVGPGTGPGIDARNFVLCPGDAYDRSPCGTGTSAKLAVLHTRGRIAPRQRLCVESVTGGRFTAWLEPEGERLVPHIRGRAYLIAEAMLRFDARDPLRGGMPGSAA